MHFFHKNLFHNKKLSNQQTNIFEKTFKPTQKLWKWPGIPSSAKNPESDHQVHQWNLNNWSANQLHQIVPGLPANQKTFHWWRQHSLDFQQFWNHILARSLIFLTIFHYGMNQWRHQNSCQHWMTSSRRLTPWKQPMRSREWNELIRFSMMKSIWFRSKTNAAKNFDPV